MEPKAGVRGSSGLTTEDVEDAAWGFIGNSEALFMGEGGLPTGDFIDGGVRFICEFAGEGTAPD